jgi:hypothetical protein
MAMFVAGGDAILAVMLGWIDAGENRHELSVMSYEFWVMSSGS